MKEYTPYERLANAIIRQAVHDYARAIRKGDSICAKECRRFFLSDWFQALTNLEGKTLLDIIDRRLKRREKRK